MNAQEFFTALYGELGGEERVELRAFNPVGRWWVGDVKDIANVVAQRKDNLYFGVNPRKGEHGTNADVSRIVAVIADIDAKNVDDPNEALCDYGLTPSAIIQSGGGVHAYWFLESPRADSDDFVKARQEFLRLGKSDAVHDAARILRVPGTVNTKYGAPRPVTLSDLRPSLRYPRDVFGKLLKMDPDLRRRMYTGSIEGFPSRSERDFSVLLSMMGQGWTDEEITAVLPTCNMGERYRERPQLLQLELKNARAKAKTYAVRGIEEFITKENATWRRKGAEERKVATFIFEPEALLEGDNETEDTILGSVNAEGTTHTWRHFQLPRKAFTDRRHLTKCLPFAAMSWLGTDTDVIHFLPHLVRTLQEKGVPRLHTVKSLGRHGTVWVTPKNVITPSDVSTFTEAGFAFLDRYQEKPDVKYVVKSKDEVAPVFRKIYDLIPQINDPGASWLIFSWFLASLYKPLLGPDGREFPFMQVVGTRGAGKTSTLKDVFLPIVGYASPRSYSCDTTDFVMMALMSSSSSIPVFFAEYRATLPNIERFMRRIRLSYDTGFDARGRSDQTTVSYELCAPIVVDGENPIDDPALRERSVVVTLHPEALTQGRKMAFSNMTNLPLNGVAGFLVQWSLRQNPTLEKASKLVEESNLGTLPDRVRRNLVKMAFGYGTAQKLALDLEIPIPDYSFYQMVKPWLDTIMLGTTGRTPVLVDEFVEDIINALAQAQVTRGAAVDRNKSQAVGYEPFLWGYDAKEHRVRFHLATALTWWTKERKRAGLATLTKTTAHSQLMERKASTPANGQYVVSYGPSWGPGGIMNMYVVDLASACESGLDIPQKLSTLVISGRDQ
jgi:hypothetical protein